MSTTKESIEQAAKELGLSIKSEFVPFSKSCSADEKLPSLNWKVTLVRNDREILTTDYSAGCAHCPSYKQGDNSVDRHEAVRLECESGRPSRMSGGLGVISYKGLPQLVPSFADVLHSLASDCDVLNYSTFEEWASSVGYDTDSRKAETIYRTCLDFALRLRNALGESGVEKLQEAVRDY